MQLFTNKFKLFKTVRGKNFIYNSGFSANLFIISILSSLLFFPELNAQSISVSGKVTSNRFPVRNASVTFIDNGDTNKQYVSYTDDTGIYSIDNITSIGSEANNLPSKFELGQNYPNPFSNLTAIPYSLNEQIDIHVTIYDILGREVRDFSIGSQSAGIHSILWDGKNILGQKVASGVYFYKLQSKGESVVKKMILNQSGTASIKIPNIQSHSFSKLPVKNRAVEATSFTVQIGNTAATIPYIVPQEIDNVTIQNDTTINLSVSYMSSATLQFDSPRQVIRGFGAASPWYLSVLTDSEVESAFGMEEGQIGLSIYRITLEADSNRWSRYLPAARRAQELGAIVIASPWYAPDNLTEFRDGENRIKLDKYAEYADHLNAFVKFMERNEIPVYGISIQNEPEMGDWTNWSPDEMFTFMRDYAGAIEGTYVMAPEVSNFGRQYSDLILNDPTATENTDIVIGHIYGGGLFEYPLAEEKGKEVWMTEYLLGENNSGNNMPWAIELAENINAVMKANMSAYVWWTMVRYYGPIGDGTRASNPADPNESYPSKGEVTKKGYVLSQFSKFIRPGYQRVEGTIYPPGGNVSVTAYKDPSTSKVVIVAINSGSSQIEYAFKVGTDAMISTLSSYTTSESKNCEQGESVNIIDGTFLYTLEPMSITTFISD